MDATRSWDGISRWDGVAQVLFCLAAFNRDEEALVDIARGLSVTRQRRIYDGKFRLKPEREE